MKRLSFERLELLSLTERKARTIEFHPKLTIIQGMNGVGKSSVIKSLYWTLGAAPQAIHRDWVAAKVKSRLHMRIDDAAYSVVRDGRQLAMFDVDGKKLISTNSITHEFGPFLADKLDFGLTLLNRQNEPEVPPPAYAFLPFYMDQDGGWERPLSSFDRLTQYANFRRAIIEYHSGIKPNEFYKISAERTVAARLKSEALSERNTVAGVIAKLGLDPVFQGIELSAYAHDAAVEDLLARLTELRDARQRRAAKLAAVVDERLLLEEQIELARAAARELGADANWAASDGRETIACPTCGTDHRNDFRHRFSILADRDQCFEFVASSLDKIDDLAKKARDVEKEMVSTDRIIAEVQSTLEVERERVTLKEVIENEGRRQAMSLFNEQISELDEKIGTFEASIVEMEAALKEFNKRQHREQRERFYAERMRSYIDKLNVLNPDYDTISKITGRIVETGSEQPRLLLAYELALLATIQEYSTAFAAPMVIDSPNQQDQDDRNARSMLSLIIDSRHPRGQTILGTVSMHGIDPGDASVIEFTDKRSVLQSSEFEVVSGSLRPVLEML
ncbi:AAA family ATPase [Rhizobium rhizogenes]|uniref:ATP-binding protein n=1 Tax=Rhizobium rhizogenes TaxID=359 RepID=UPI00193D0290|nr:ATP-binding protein [Rhizobium rhizogenes]QRM40544.1 AAA family ATPase [Rhizobium rhizogenes]